MGTDADNKSNKKGRKYRMKSGDGEEIGAESQALNTEESKKPENPFDTDASEFYRQGKK